MKRELTTRQVTTLCVEAQNILSALSDYKELYRRLDEITVLLVGHTIAPKHKLVVIDNFETKNVSWKSTGIRRYELKRVG